MNKFDVRGIVAAVCMVLLAYFGSYVCLFCAINAGISFTTAGMIRKESRKQ